MKKIYICLSILLLVFALLFPIVSYAGVIDTSNWEDNASINAQVNKRINDTINNIEFIPYLEFMDLLEDKKIIKVFMDDENSNFYFLTNDNNYYQTNNPKSEDFRLTLLNNGIEILENNDIYDEDCFIEETKAKVKERTTKNVVSLICTLGLFALGFYWLFRIVDRSEKSMSFIGKEQSKSFGNGSNNNVKTFEDVAGLKEVKEDVTILVDFLKNGTKYKQMGAKLPKGVILYGPPGTGKTLLAKAIAGEAGVPFISAVGSDFVEMYVGMGPKRVRELFNKAKKNAPCIIFIDEIDAICGKRNANEHSEDRKTINAFLAEMDGFDTTDNILVIGATNRLEDIDSAVLRPGRFTNKYCVPLPESLEDRLTILELYSKNKKLLEDVDLHKLAKDTLGCSPAELESILNEAAIIATKNKLSGISSKCIEEAFNKNILKGHIKKDSSNRLKEELELVAWHEAGHALVGILLGADVNKITILSSTTGAGGATFITPKKMGLFSIDELKHQVIQLYAGRCAEYIYYNDWNKTTTGASNDIERATEIIYQMVSIYGMNENYGMLNLNKMNIDNNVILEEATKISKQLQEECVSILEAHKDDLEKIVKLLLEKETIYIEELDFINR